MTYLVIRERDKYVFGGIRMSAGRRPPATEAIQRIIYSNMPAHGLAASDDTDVVVATGHRKTAADRVKTK
jgi:hypothetical protein